MSKKLPKFPNKIRMVQKRKINMANILLVAIATCGPIIVISLLLYKIVDSNIPVRTEESIISSGLAIIAMAVSVWIGLNIYNTVSKKELEETIKKVKASETTLNKYIFLNEIEKTMETYEFSKYLYYEFQSINVEQDNIDFRMLKEIEARYVHCCYAYEKNHWKAARENAEQLKERIIGAIRTNRSSIKNYNLLAIYLYSRLSDSLFYSSIALPRESGTKPDIDAMKKSIEYYKEILSQIDDVYEDNIYIAYIYNTLGYTQYLLSKYDSEEASEEASEMRKIALNNMNKAIELNKDKGRYYRNRGLIYDFYFCKDELRMVEQPSLKKEQAYNKAKADYMKAVECDKEDYKAYNNLGALYLRKLDYENKIHVREETLDKIVIKGNEEEIRYCLSCFEIACAISPYFEDALYNRGKAYMYLYLINPKRKMGLIMKGIQYTKQVEIINENNPGYKYVLRNIYEASGNISEAMKINDKLGGQGDSTKIGEMYKKIHSSM